jgi:hypothetical protein
MDLGPIHECALAILLDRAPNPIIRTDGKHNAFGVGFAPERDANGVAVIDRRGAYKRARAISMASMHRDRDALHAASNELSARIAHGLRIRDLLLGRRGNRLTQFRGQIA